MTIHHQIKRSYSDETKFKLTKALIVTKLSRLEFEQHRHAKLSQLELEKCIRDRGTDYDAMLNYHKIHKDFERKVADSFNELGVEVKLVNRFLSHKNISILVVDNTLII